MKIGRITINNSCGSKYIEYIRINEVLPYIEGKLLDVGCGCNNLVNNYKNIYKKTAIGIDVFAWPGVDLVVKDSSKLNYKSNSFDTVSFIANINHIPYREKALKEAYRLLKPNGLLIITMIPRDFGEFWHKFPERLWGEREKGREFAEGEVGGINSSEVKSLVESAGFVNVTVKKFMIFNNLFLARKNES